MLTAQQSLFIAALRYLEALLSQTKTELDALSTKLDALLARGAANDKAYTDQIAALKATNATLTAENATLTAQVASGVDNPAEVAQIVALESKVDAAIPLATPAS